MSISHRRSRAFIFSVWRAAVLSGCDIKSYKTAKWPTDRHTVIPAVTARRCVLVRNGTSEQHTGSLLKRAGTKGGYYNSTRRSLPNAL